MSIKTSDPMSARAAPPLDRARQRAGCGALGCGLLFFGVFFTVGAAILFGSLIPLMIQFRHSGAWIAAPCEITESHVESQDDDDGASFRPHITYSYRFGGQTYQSKQISVAPIFSSSDYNCAQDLVTAYPPGKHTVCWVDPQNPSHAVLSRSYTGSYPSFVLGLLFLLVGAVGIGAILRSFGKFRDQRKTRFHIIRGAPGEPIALRPRSTRFIRLLRILALNLFWNGIESVLSRLEEPEELDRVRPADAPVNLAAVAGQ